MCLLVGESGSGKSAVAKFVAMRRYDRVIWVSADAMESGRAGGLERELGLRHPLPDLLGPRRDTCLLVFDSIEKHADAAIRYLGRTLTGIHADPDCRHVHAHLSLLRSRRRRDSWTRCGEKESKVKPCSLSPSVNATSHDLGMVMRAMPNLTWAIKQKDLRLSARQPEGTGLRGAGAGERRGRESPPVGLPAIIDFVWEGWIRGGTDGIACGVALQRTGRAGRGRTHCRGAGVEAHACRACRAAVARTEGTRSCRERARRPSGTTCLATGPDCESWSASSRFPSLNWRNGQHPRAGIRQYACLRSTILAQANGVDSWRRVIKGASHGEIGNTLLRDLFVEAIVLAENAEQLLELDVARPPGRRCSPTGTAARPFSLRGDRPRSAYPSDSRRGRLGGSLRGVLSTSVLAVLGSSARVPSQTYGRSRPLCPAACGTGL